ncbi:MAG TPA: DUF2127 domain-containing protein [Acidimicrobiales bacterium]|nr:DUF2127 domain-containing protein [Acidimicrobiales bacterium]
MADPPAAAGDPGYPSGSDALSAPGDPGRPGDGGDAGDSAAQLPSFEGPSGGYPPPELGDLDPPPDEPPPRPHTAAPGTEAPRRFLPKLRYELLACGLHGHRIVGTDAAELRPEDDIFAYDLDGLRWYRCLRCDAWVVLPHPAHPARQYPPEPNQIALPLRGRPLRDRFVLRTIAVERVLHLVVLGALNVAIFLFIAHRPSLKATWTRILADLQGSLGGPLDNSPHGVLSDLNRLFTVKVGELVLIGIALAAYNAVLVLEIVGLWWARRWAEYLTFAEASVLVPFEIYELTNGVTALKVVGLIVNLAILLYLALGHRLFGLRGGVRAEKLEHDRDRGWSPIIAATPLRRTGRTGVGDIEHVHRSPAATRG